MQVIVLACQKEYICFYDIILPYVSKCSMRQSCNLSTVRSVHRRVLFHNILHTQIRIGSTKRTTQHEDPARGEFYFPHVSRVCVAAAQLWTEQEVLRFDIPYLRCLYLIIVPMENIRCVTGCEDLFKDITNSLM